MTMPPVIRIFFAIDLPEAAKKKINSYLLALKKKAKTNAIRWSKPENLHITLQFLPEVQSAHLPKLLKHVQEKLKGGIKQSKIHFGKLCLFPNPYRPRVIVLEVTPQEELAGLSALVGAGINEAAYDTEDKPFRAHLTLGRIKHPQGVKLDFLNEADALEIEDLPFDDIALFRSEPQAEGSLYTVIERIKLSN